MPQRASFKGEKLSYKVKLLFVGVFAVLGASLPSASISFVFAAATIPAAPSVTGVTVSLSGALDVSFVAGADGGSPITDFDFEVATTASFLTPTFVENGTDINLTQTVSGLTNGTRYYVKVRETTSAGDSPWSLKSAPITPFTTPSAPLRANAKASGSKTVVVAFAAAFDGGSAVTDFDFEYSTTAGFASGTGTFVENGSNAATTQTLTGLSNGTSYYFHVQAQNAAGVSDWSSETAVVTPFTNPATPLIVSSVRAASSTVEVAFVSPTDNGATVTDFDFEYSTNPLFTAGSGTFVENGTLTTTTQSITGLNNGTTYFFRVRSTNLAGNSLWSLPSGGTVAFTIPSQPLNVSGSIGASQVQLSWLAPASNGGDPVTQYRVSVFDSNGLTAIGVGSLPVQETLSPLLSFVFAGLSNAVPYTFAVEAQNGAGWGPMSVRSPVLVPATVQVPDQPTVVSVIGGNAELVVNFQYGWDGGSPVTDFDVEWSSDQTFGTATFVEAGTSVALSYTLANLVNGLSYSVRIRAHNAVGDSLWSNPSVVVTPQTVPESPTFPVSAVTQLSPLALSVKWVKPADGGTPIVRYEVEASDDSGVTWRLVARPVAATTQVVSSGLVAGTLYEYRVRAQNAEGFSSWSQTSPAIMAVDIPMLPSGLVATPLDSSVVVSWDLLNVALSNPSTSIDVLVDGVTVCSLTDLKQTSCLVSALDNFATYKLSVVVRGVVGSSAVWSQDVVPVGAPSAPRSVVALVQQRSLIQVSFVMSAVWQVPSTSVEAEITLDSGVSWQTARVLGNTSPITVWPNIGGVAQRVRLRLVTPLGVSAWSVPSNVVWPNTPPGQPVLVLATPGDKRTTLQYSVPFTGGIPVSKYEVQMSSDGGLTWFDTVNDVKIPVTVTWLSNSASYMFKARAWNTIGSSLWSVPSPIQYPFDLVPAPQVGAKTVGSTVEVFWSAIEDTDSRTVTSYRVFDAVTSVLVCETLSTAPRSCSLPSGVGSTVTLRVAAVAIDRAGVEHQGLLSKVVSGSVRAGVTDVVLPVKVRAIGGDETIKIVFSPPQATISSRPPSGLRGYVDGVFACQVPYPGPLVCTGHDFANGVAHSVTGTAFFNDLESVESLPVTVMCTLWVSPAPQGMVSQVGSTGLLIAALKTAQTPLVSGYQLFKDGVFVASLASPRFIDQTTRLAPGTYEYKIRAIGPKGRFGEFATLVVTLDALPTPDLALTSVTGPKVTFLPSGVSQLDPSSRWVLWRNNIPVKEFAVTDPSAPFVFSSRTQGTFTYQLQLIAPQGVSGLSAPIQVTVR